MGDLSGPDPSLITFEGPVQKLSFQDNTPRASLQFYRRWRSSSTPLYCRRYCTLAANELTYWHIVTANNTIDSRGKKKRMSSKMSHKKAGTFKLMPEHTFRTTGTIGEFVIGKEGQPDVVLRAVGANRGDKAKQWVKALRRATGKTEDEGELQIGHDSDAEPEPEDDSSDDEAAQQLAAEFDGEWTRGETIISATVEATERTSIPAARVNTNALGGRTPQEAAEFRRECQLSTLPQQIDPDCARSNYSPKEAAQWRRHWQGLEASAPAAAKREFGKKARPSMLTSFKSEYEEEEEGDAEAGTGEIDLDNIDESADIANFQQVQDEQQEDEVEEDAHQKLIPLIAAETGGDPERAEERMAELLELHGSYAAAHEALSGEEPGEDI